MEDVLRVARRRGSMPAKATIASLILLVGLAILTGTHWLILILRLPVLTSLRWWFWPFRDQPLEMAWIGAAAVALLAAAVIGFSKLPTPVKLGLLVVLGATLQFSFAFSKGHGLDGIRDRLVNTGHGQLANLAVRAKGVGKVILNYEHAAVDRQLGPFAMSKPPGMLLLYMLTEKLANLNKSNASMDERLESVRTFASITWPVISYLVIVPLFLLARMLLDCKGAMTACLFYLCIPSVTLVTMHTDQVFFPLFAVVPVVLASRASSRESAFLAFLGGVALYWAVYCSFGLAVIAALMLAAFFISPSENLQLRGGQMPAGVRLAGANASTTASPAATERRVPTEDRPREADQGTDGVQAVTFFNPGVVKLLGVTFVGAIACDILTRLFLNYDILVRYRHAIAWHSSLKGGWDGRIQTALTAALTNLTEFAVWLGMPMSVLLVGAVCFALYQVFVRRISPPSVFTLALAAIFVFLCLFGKTKAETARIWLFMVPFVCVVVARFIREITRHGARQAVLIALVLALEFGTTCLTVRYQDFH